MAKWKKIVNETPYKWDDEQYKLSSRINRTLWNFTDEMYEYFSNKYDGEDKDSEVGNEAFQKFRKEFFWKLGDVIVDWVAKH